MDRRRLLAVSLALPGSAWAQAPTAPDTWPSRPVRILLAYPPGGSTDVLARTLADRLAVAIAGPGFVVENRPGGAAVVGTQAAALAAPDGHTLSLGNNQTHAANAAMVRDLPYRPVEDFAPIGRLAEVHHALVVPAGSPARRLAELVKHGRDGAKLTYASSGVGSASHVLAESLVRREGMEATHVPYRGGAQAVTDTISGTVDFFVSTWPQVVALVKEGRRALPGRGCLVRPLGAGADAAARGDAAVGRAAGDPGRTGDRGAAGGPRLPPGAAAGGGVRRLPAGGGGAVGGAGDADRHPAGGMSAGPHAPAGGTAGGRAAPPARPWPLTPAAKAPCIPGLHRHGRRPQGRPG